MFNQSVTAKGGVLARRANIPPKAMVTKVWWIALQPAMCIAVCRHHALRCVCEPEMPFAL